MQHSEWIYLIIINLLCLFSLGLLYFYYIKDEEMGRLKRDLNFYNSTYLSHQGGTLLWGDGKKIINYNLRSFDGGKKWYACEICNNGELKILGEAEVIYPGLMKSLVAWNKIKEHVDKNGPIQMSDLTPEFEKTLNDAKITIERK